MPSLAKYRHKRDFEQTSEPQGGRLPAGQAPQLATLVKEAPAGDAWVHEIKFDGYRVLARVEDGKVTLLTRNGKDWTHRMGAVAEALERLKGASALLDGEVVVVDDAGVSDFQMLQNSLSEGKDSALVYYAFDLLYLGARGLKQAENSAKPTKAPTPAKQTRAIDAAPVNTDYPITNPVKVLYAEQGITKRELLDYYASVAERMFARHFNSREGGQVAVQRAGRQLGPLRLGSAGRPRNPYLGVARRRLRAP